MLIRETTYEGLTRLTRIAQDQGDAGEDWLRRVFERRFGPTVKWVIDVVEETGDPIGRVLAQHLVETQVSDESILRLLGRCHQPGVSRVVPVRELALVVTQKARASLLSAIPEAGDSAREEALAGLDGNLSHWFSAVGQRDEAVRMAEEALARWRRLVTADPERYRAALARAFDRLGQRLDAVGRFEAAHQACREAVELSRRLVLENPAENRSILAQCLANLSLILRSLERRRESLEKAREATDLYRELAARTPKVGRPDLARAVHNLASHQMRAGQLNEALASAGEAVQLRRSLAADRPLAYQTDLASSLELLAEVQHRRGHDHEAFAGTREALTIRQSFAEARPDVFGPELARSLDALGSRLSRLGQLVEAHKMFVASAEVRRRLAEDRPRIFNPECGADLRGLVGRDENGPSASCSAAPRANDEQFEDRRRTGRVLGGALSDPVLPEARMNVGLVSGPAQRTFDLDGVVGDSPAFFSRDGDELEGIVARREGVDP